MTRPSPAQLARAAAYAAALIAAGCAGGGGQGALMPGGGFAGTGNTVVRIFVPAGAQLNAPKAGAPIPPAAGGPPAPTSGAPTNAQAPALPPLSTAAPPGSQVLAISVSGPTTISQSVPVGPNAQGCAPASGGSTCQLALSLPGGTYTGTIAGSAVAFTVQPGSNNTLNLTLGGVPSQVVVVPASSMSGLNAQGGIDLYGAGKHPLLVELMDANQNVMIGGGANFGLNQAGGSLSLTVSQTAAPAPNLFYVGTPATASTGAAILRATVNYPGPINPCAASAATCNGTVRVDSRQLLAVANSGAGSVTLYVAGQTAPLVTVQAGIADPQAVAFDVAGDLFVANQPGSVTEYAPPYTQAPVSIGSGVSHPQGLAVDARGNVFVANGNGSNTIMIYSPPYGGAAAAAISSGVDDPVSLALDSDDDLFVVNESANTVTEYAPPYGAAPTTISKGLNAPGSLALDVHGNLFVANLNSTPNSVVEYAPPFSSNSAPAATITNGVNEQGSITVVSANLFVPNEGANTVTEYTAPFTGAPATIVGGQSQPVALAVDASGNLYVANYGNNTVTQYEPPYAPGSWATIATGVAPVALALSPVTSGGPALLP